MQSYQSAMPITLSPVCNDIAKASVPFLPYVKNIAKSATYRSTCAFVAHAATSATHLNHSSHVRPNHGLSNDVSNTRSVFANKFIKLKAFSLLSMLMPASLVFTAALYLPFSSSFQNKITSQVIPTTPQVSLNAIVAKRTLTIVTTQGNSTYFGNDGYQHGFGHDVMNSYANKLGVKLNTLVVANEAAALAAVNQGQADMLLTNLPAGLPDNAANDEKLATVSLSCEQDFLSSHGLSSKTAVVMPNADLALVTDTQDFLCDPLVLNTNQQLAAFYTTKFFDDDYSQSKFNQVMTTQLPNYRSLFQQSAQKHDLDWELLVAMGYQESHLEPNAVSPTGVRGLMMLTNDTAEAMGVTDRVDAKQSIKGGAKYLQILNKQFDDVPESDRIWFTLAAYNMGPQAIRNVQDQLKVQGRNSNSWAEVYRYLADNAGSNSRYVQCMHYVTNIRGYLEAIKLDAVNQNKKPDSHKVA